MICFVTLYCVQQAKTLNYDIADEKDKLFTVSGELNQGLRAFSESDFAKVRNAVLIGDFTASEKEFSEIKCYVKGKSFVNEGKVPDNFAEENQILLGKFQFPKGNIGDEVSVNGVLCKVVGINYVADFSVVNLCAIEKMKISRVEIYTKTKPSDREEERVVSWLKEVFGNECDYVLPQPLDASGFVSRNAVYLLITLIFSIFLINSMILYNFEINRRTRQIYVVKLCGNSRKKILSAYFTECVIYAAAQFLSGAVAMLVVNAFARPAYPLAFGEYAVTALAYMAMIAAVSYPQLSRLTKKNYEEDAK